MRAACPDSAVAVTMAGPGIEIVRGFDVCDAPASFIAATRYVYAPPGCTSWSTKWLVGTTATCASSVQPGPVHRFTRKAISLRLLSDHASAISVGLPIKPSRLDGAAGTASGDSTPGPVPSEQARQAMPAKSAI